MAALATGFADSPDLPYLRSAMALRVDALLERLAVALSAHNPSTHEWSFGLSNGYQRAGVLVPLILDGGTLDLLFTKRTEQVETHKGQISFPGGAVDRTDRDIVHTAVREAEEELGIPETAVQLLGLLESLSTPTGFVITPVVGVLRGLPSLCPNSHEVAEVFTVPLEFFRDERNARREIWMVEGREQEVWFYTWGGHVIWGATAIILRSLLRVIALLPGEV